MLSREAIDANHEAYAEPDEPYYSHMTRGSRLAFRRRGFFPDEDRDTRRDVWRNYYGDE